MATPNSSSSFPKVFRSTQSLANIVIRTLVTALIFAVLPTYVFILYLTHNRIFSYDLFADGAFGMSVFFGFSAVLCGFITLLWVIALYFFGRAKQTRKLWDGVAAVFYMATLLLLTVLLIWMTSFKVFTFITMPGLFFVGMVIAALRMQTSHYLVLILIVIPTFFVLLFVGSEPVSKVIALALAQYRVGGGVPVHLESSRTSEETKGKLVLLSPRYVFLRASNRMWVLPRTGDLRISFDEQVQNGKEIKK